jgi:Permeases of the drug/metabolite transporter (DMT) superfamily
MEKKYDYGHLAALITIFIWGTTFVSTKVLLEGFSPIEILFFRFVLGYLILFLMYPKQLHTSSKKQEIYFALAGLSGICVYYLLENIALTYTQASNVGVIISVAPFFTGILYSIIQGNKLNTRFFIGFVMAMIGIMLISFHKMEIQINPLGDFLALLAALTWACYSVLSKKISEFGYPSVLITRRIFAYGLVFMIPAMFLFDFKLELVRFTNKIYVFNILFLGIGASALCFVTWNYAVKVIGAVKTSIYIYLVPVITVIASTLILKERISIKTIFGIGITMAGLFVSEEKEKKTKRLPTT